MGALSTYPLAMGQSGATRLDLLQRVYGRESQRFLLDAGLAQGMWVADIGCGTGAMTRWLATQVGPQGRVYGVDGSAEQIGVALSRNEGQISAQFVVSDVHDLHLPKGQFDLIYSRLLLCHLARPADALAQMAGLLKRGGVLVCEELDLCPEATEPPDPAYDAMIQDSIRSARARGADYHIGRKLPAMLERLGVRVEDCRMWAPGYLRGEAKRLDASSMLEEAAQRLSQGSCSQAHVDAIKSRLDQATHDEEVLILQTRVAQVRGRVA